MAALAPPRAGGSRLPEPRFVLATCTCWLDFRTEALRVKISLFYRILFVCSYLASPLRATHREFVLVGICTWLAWIGLRVAPRSGESQTAATLAHYNPIAQLRVRSEAIAGQLMFGCDGVGSFHRIRDGTNFEILIKFVLLQFHFGLRRK